MEKKIQLRHPAGKKAISMDERKYTILKKIIVSLLKEREELSHPEILKAIIQGFKKNKTKFQGSVEWHLEWVKLDLEAHKIIERIPGKSGMKFRLAELPA